MLRDVVLRQKKCCTINFIFEGCLGVVLGYSVVGVSAGDLAHEFDDGRFCGDIRVRC